MEEEGLVKYQLPVFELCETSGALLAVVNKFDLKISF
jgi:hypothetical protein